MAARPTSSAESAPPVLVYLYFDHSNIVIEAKNIGQETESAELGGDVWRRLCLDFHNLMLLAHENRPLAKAVAAGSVPPDMQTVWNRLEQEGVQTEIFDRSEMGGSERNVPDLYLQKEMLRDGLQRRDSPGTIVLLTGDGAGYYQGKGFLDVLEILQGTGWKIELLSWDRSCNVRLREWVCRHGFYTSLDQFYDSITFVEARGERRGRTSQPLKLERKRAKPWKQFARGPGPAP